VPALGLLALSRIEPARHGAAAGLFFAWFDAGVGLGGPAAGLLADLGGPSGALLGAAVAVACAAPIAAISAIRPRRGPLVN
jgi:predicted MFS family arabinose efflux permease